MLYKKLYISLDHDIKSLLNTVNANILGIPFPFAGVDGEDACKHIYNEDGTTKVGCNIKAGQEYVYKNEIEVLKIYPRVSNFYLVIQRNRFFYKFMVLFLHIDVVKSFFFSE